MLNTYRPLNLGSTVFSSLVFVRRPFVSQFARQFCWSYLIRIVSLFLLLNSMCKMHVHQKSLATLLLTFKIVKYLRGRILAHRKILLFFSFLCVHTYKKQNFELKNKRDFYFDCKSVNECS